MSTTISPGSLILYGQPVITIIHLCATKKSSWTRKLNLGILASLLFLHLQSLEGKPTKPAEVFSRSVPIAMFLHMANILSLISAEDLFKQPGVRTLFSRLRLALKLTIDLRAGGTCWEVRNLPRFSSFFGIGPPKRGPFLVRQLAIGLWQYLFLDLVIHGYANNPFFRDHMETVLLDPSQRAPFAVEAVIEVAKWFVIIPISFDFAERAFSCVMVGLGISEPEFWPPLFGSMRHASTIRGFWGSYWHQELRAPLTAASSYFLRKVLRIPHPSIAERYLNMFLCFFLSGVIHIPAQMKGMAWSNAGAIHFFASFALAIMIEDIAQYVRTIIRKGKHEPTTVKPVIAWTTIVGYIWVISWFTVFGPPYSYDALYVSIVDVLPFSFNITALLGVPVTMALLITFGSVGSFWFQVTI